MTCTIRSCTKPEAGVISVLLPTRVKTERLCPEHMERLCNILSIAKPRIVQSYCAESFVPQPSIFADL